jgi:hypothetical protein
MTISFDLDDTLIPGTIQFTTEPAGFWRRIFGHEPLRAGTAALMLELQHRGHRIFIYTTSLRSPAYIRRLFRLHGVRLDGVVNQARHEAVLGDRRRDHSKLPPAFGIDVHIDDSPGVGIEGRRHAFRTIILSPDTSDWTGFILNEIAAGAL